MVFLQNFFEDEILCDWSKDRVAGEALLKAKEIAMLGMPEEANAILKLLSDHGLFRFGDASFEIECIWTSSGLPPPDLSRGGEGAVWVPSEESLMKKELELGRQFPYLPDYAHWSCVDQRMFDRLSGWLDTQRDSEHSDASTGFQAMKVSSGLAALLAMSSELGTEDTMLKQMSIMSIVAKRVHANCQMDYLGTVRAVWEPYLLSGWLRERLDLTVKSVQEYAHFVLSTTQARLERGAIRPDELYAGFSMEQVIEHINQNTITTEGYTDEDINVDAGEEEFRQDSIMREPATVEHIEQAEKRLGRQIPSEMKEFYRLTNGTGRVRRSEDFDIRLAPLDDLFYEEEQYMEDYSFNLLPKFEGVDVMAPGISGGAISMYEGDGQGTLYVWVVTAELIRDAKKRLSEAYEAADAVGKASVDQAIVDYYGSREVFNAMNDYCIYQQPWAGDGESDVFPTFRAYLLNVAFESRHQVERSPLPKPEF